MVRSTHPLGNLGTEGPARVPLPGRDPGAAGNRTVPVRPEFRTWLCQLLGLRTPTQKFIPLSVSFQHV